MKLTKEEQAMLDGRFGEVVQKSMEILVAVGEAYDAERMVQIGSAHLVGPNPVTAGKGSTLGSYQLYEMTIWKKAPKAIINVRADPIVAVGAIIGNIPMVDKLDQNPLEVIMTGDLTEVDADQGIVRVDRR